MQQLQQSTRLVLAILGAVALTLSLTSRPAPAAAQDDPGAPGEAAEVAVDLEGTWRFATGDDPAWADPAFDDSAWEEVAVPTDGGQPIFADYDGFAWFRLAFDLPEGADAVNLVASLGFIDDADQAYLNGVEIGRTGVLPPDAEDSQWFERRLYPVPAGAAVAGGRNVLAVRMNDFTGGGGWYRGPVGLFSKSALREAVYGITASAAPAAVDAAARDLLARQAAALAAGDVEGYLATLGDGYQHDGRDRDRRGREITRWLEASGGSLTLTDSEVEVVVADDGRVLVDTNRAITGTRDGEPYAWQPLAQQFLVVDPAAAGGAVEVGNRSRFFRDHVDSAAEGQRREYVVYLPPSYFTSPGTRFPVVYLLHGINGGSREWEPREFDRRLDELFTTGGLAESIVVMPDGESLWYIDSSVTPWRTMFTTELVPQVDAEYRTLPERAFRGLSGVSMGGHGAFTIGWAHPELFASIASHMGALSLPPLVGSSEEIAQNTPETPLVQVQGHTPDFLSQYRYYFDACADDDFRFGEAVQAMDGALSAKLVEHTAVVFPEGRHNDECWLPHIDASFGLHSDAFRAAGLVEPPPAVPVERVAGASRVDTAIAVSQAGFEAADAVVVASADGFADALAAGPLAMATGGPLLLSPAAALPESVVEEVRRLGAERAYLAGGEAALSPAVEARLAAEGVEVVRLAGEDRYATAAEIAAEIGRIGSADSGGSSGGGLDRAVLATGEAFADALAASAVAAGGRTAVLLSRPGDLPAATASALDGLLADGATVVVAGGEAALSSDVASAVEALGLVVDRAAGDDRYATAAALRERAVAAGADDDPLVVASGAAFPDALTAGVLAARLDGGLVLVDPQDLAASPATADLLPGISTTRVLVAGGPAAVSDRVLGQITSALSG